MLIRKKRGIIIGGAAGIAAAIFVATGSFIFLSSPDKANAATLTPREHIPAANGTFSITPTHRAVNVEMAAIGGGGGGGGAYASTNLGSNVAGAGGGGGGGGGYTIHSLGTVTGTFTFTIGGGGNSGVGATSNTGSTASCVANQSNGCAGGDSSVTFGATTITAYGGYGGSNAARRRGRPGRPWRHDNQRRQWRWRHQRLRALHGFSGVGGASGYGSAGGAGRTQTGSGSTAGDTPTSGYGGGGGGAAARTNSSYTSNSNTGGRGRVGGIIISWDEFTAEATLTSLSPATGFITPFSNSADRTVTLYGDFTDIQMNPNAFTVYFGTMTASIISASPTEIVVSYPETATPGAVDVKIAYTDSVYDFTDWETDSLPFTYQDTYLTFSSASETLNITYSPSDSIPANGVLAAKTALTVSTNNPSGYTLTLAPQGGNTDLVCTAHSSLVIPTIGAAGALDIGTYGYKISVSDQNGVNSGWQASRSRARRGR